MCYTIDSGKGALASHIKLEVPMTNPRYVIEPGSPRHVRFTYETEGSHHLNYNGDRYSVPRTVRAREAIRRELITMNDLPIVKE